MALFFFYKNTFTFILSFIHQLMLQTVYIGTQQCVMKFLTFSKDLFCIYQLYYIVQCLLSLLVHDFNASYHVTSFPYLLFCRDMLSRPASLSPHLPFAAQKGDWLNEYYCTE